MKENTQVYALCRNTESEAAQALTSLGIKVVEGDLNDPESYATHLQGMDGVFSVQAFNKKHQQEVAQGCALADEAHAANVPHFVYASVYMADQDTGIPHFESKNAIEEHIKNSGLTYTILRPVSFCENLLNPRVKNSILKGKLIMPLNKETVQQHISLHDIGVIGSQVLTNPQQFANKIMTIATDQMTMEELSDLFGEVLHQKMKYQKLPGLITRLSMGKDLSKMFKWMDQNEITLEQDIDGLKSTFPGLIDMKTWIKENF